MFGPAHMTNLIQSHGATVEAPIQFAPSSDPKGCKTPEKSPVGSWMPTNIPELLDELEMCPSSNIQLVNRGTCSFATKAANQQQGRNADAVIVINILDDIFTMAGDPNVDSVDPDSTPLTVMISRGDGQKLLSTMHRYRKNDGRIIGKVELKAQASIEDLEAEAEKGSPVHLPVVFATDSLIYIYAEGFWGVQATIVNNNWNLQLVRHQLG